MLEEKVKSQKIADFSAWEYVSRVISQESERKYLKKRIAKKSVNKWKYQNG